MKIPLNVLLYQLSPNSIYESQNIDLSKGIDGIKLFDEDDAGDSEKNYIYMGSEEMFRTYSPLLLSQQQLSPCSFLCVTSDESLHLESFPKDLSLILLYKKESFSSIFNLIVNIFLDFRTWHKDFHLELLRNASMQRLLDMSQDYLVHPAIVLDRNYSVLGYVRNPDCDIPLMDTILSDGYITPQTMTSLYQNGLMSPSQNSTNPYINYYCLSSRECYYSMMYRFYSNNHEVGYMLVFRCSVHPKTNYLYLMNAVADNLQLYFQQERYQNRSTSDMYESFLSEIMEHPDLEDKQYQDQISYIPGLSMNGYFLLAKVEYNNQIELPYTFACWNIRNSISQLRPFICQNSMYVLRILSDGKDFSTFLNTEEEQLFLKCFHGQPITCGISGAFFSLKDLQTAAIQCKETLLLGKAGCEHTNKFYNFADYHTHYLLKELKQHVPMKMMSSPCYTILKQYDIEHHTDLCDVFMQYLKNGRNINQTSSATFMHRNTVLNKIKKATQIMHNDFEDSQMLVAFILSYLNDHI